MVFITQIFIKDNFLPDQIQMLPYFQGGNGFYRLEKGDVFPGVHGTPASSRHLRELSCSMFVGNSCRLRQICSEAYVMLMDLF